MSKKKSLIKFILSIGITSFVIPASYFTNNNLKESNQEDNININTKPIQESNKIDPKVYYGDTYKSVYFNNFTEPVLSPNPDLPGFLGYVQPPLGGDATFFPETIVWTSPNLFSSWSADLNDHPSIALINNGLTTPIKPVLLSAIHSDIEGQTTTFRNQIFAVIGDKNNLNSRNQWLIRYNVSKGSPIEDDISPSLLKMNNSPIPSNMTQGALSILNDWKNNRYIVYYPGVLGQIKNEIYTFSISALNKLNVWDNEREFSGKDGWNGEPSAETYLDDRNFLMGLAAFSSDFGNNLILIVHAPDDQGGYSSKFRIMELEKDLRRVPGWRFDIQVGRSRGSGPYGSENIVPRNKIDQKIISSKINIAPIDGFFGVSYTLVTENPSSSDQFLYTQLNWQRFANTKNFLHNDVSSGTAMGIATLYVAPKAENAYIWNNPKRVFEVFLTNKMSTNANNINVMRLTPPLSPSNFGDLYTSFNIGEYPSGGTNVSNAAVFEYPGLIDNFVISLNNNTTINSAKIGSTAYDFNIINNKGGYSIVNPQSSASELGWLKNQPNQKLPSEITDNMILDMGIGTPYDRTKFIRFPFSPVSPNTVTITPEIVNILRDNTLGTIEGTLKLEMKQIESTTTTTILLNGLVNFKVEGLEVIPIPEETKIELNSDLSNTLASSLNSNNISNFFSIVSLPTGANRRWDIMNQDNKLGKARITFTTDKYYNGTNPEAIAPEGGRTFSYDAETFKKLDGTTAVEINSVATDELKNTLTVWDVNNENAQNFIRINDLVPDEEATPIFNIINQSPLQGTLSINVRIQGGYYDPGNKGLPNTNPTSTLDLGTFNIDKFLKINGATSVQPREGDDEIFTTEITNDYLISDYINIINPVPDTIITIKNRTNDPIAGEIIVELALNHAYDNNGNILKYTDTSDSTLLNWDITISGFKQGADNLSNTRILMINQDKYKDILPSAINNENVEDLTIIIRKPTNATVNYTFSEQDNISANSPEKGGSLMIKAFVKPIYNQNGILNNNGGEISIELNGLKTMPGITDLKANIGNPNILAQDILEGNLTNYYTLSNGSSIENKGTIVEIISNSLLFNNFLGNISFSYRFDNYFNIFGDLASKSEIKFLTITGFKKLTGFTEIQLKNGVSSIQEFTAKDFEISLENYDEYFIIRNPIEGSTKLTGISKISYNNAKGEVTFKIDFIDGYIDSRGVVQNTPGSIEQTISGFEIVKPENNLLYAIIGGSVGGFIVLSILVGTLIYIMNKKKNEKLLNKSSTPRNAPPTRGPMPPPSGNQAVRGPMPPPSGNQVVRGPMPPPGGNSQAGSRGPMPPPPRRA